MVQRLLINEPIFCYDCRYIYIGYTIAATALATLPISFDRLTSILSSLIFVDEIQSCRPLFFFKINSSSSCRVTLPSIPICPFRLIGPRPSTWGFDLKLRIPVWSNLYIQLRLLNWAFGLLYSHIELLILLLYLSIFNLENVSVVGARGSIFSCELFHNASGGEKMDASLIEQAILDSNLLSWRRAKLWES